MRGAPVSTARATDPAGRLPRIFTSRTAVSWKLMSSNCPSGRRTPDAPRGPASPSRAGGPALGVVLPRSASGCGWGHQKQGLPTRTTPTRPPLGRARWAMFGHSHKPALLRPTGGVQRRPSLSVRDRQRGGATGARGESRSTRPRCTRSHFVAAGTHVSLGRYKHGRVRYVRLCCIRGVTVRRAAFRGPPAIVRSQHARGLCLISQCRPGSMPGVLLPLALSPMRRADARANCTPSALGLIGRSVVWRIQGRARRTYGR